jgi:hypothetical protein
LAVALIRLEHVLENPRALLTVDLCVIRLRQLVELFLDSDLYHNKTALEQESCTGGNAVSCRMGGDAAR